jgi:hypothetical protein
MGDKTLVFICVGVILEIHRIEVGSIDLAWSLPRRVEIADFIFAMKYGTSIISSQLSPMMMSSPLMSQNGIETSLSYLI